MLDDRVQQLEEGKKVENPFCDLKRMFTDMEAMGNGNDRLGLKNTAWQNLDKAETYYHVSPARNIQRIQQKGLVGKQTSKLLRAAKPIVWFFTEDSTSHILDMAGAVAYSLSRNWFRAGDLALRKEFAVFEIDKTAVDPDCVVWDDVGEACAIACFGYEKARIAAQHINLLAVRPIPSKWLILSPNEGTPGVSSYKHSLKKRG